MEKVAAPHPSLLGSREVYVSWLPAGPDQSCQQTLPHAKRERQMLTVMRETVSDRGEEQQSGRTTPASGSPSASGARTALLEQLHT